MSDLEKLEEYAGSFIANIKVSRVGGLIRSLEIIKALKERGYQIIVGAHVGETSVLTRAGMCAAKAAGEHLVAQEGGVGQLLLEKDPAYPSLMFGTGGTIDLSKTYQVKTEEGLVEIPTENWNRGWGLECSIHQ